MGEEHWVEVVAGLTSWRKEKGNKGGSLKSEMRGQATFRCPQGGMTGGLFGSSHGGKRHSDKST